MSIRNMQLEMVQAQDNEMKFILTVEERGWEIRYWNEFFDQIGESIAASWNVDQLYATLNSKGFQITRKELHKAVKELKEDTSKTFIVLSSKQKSPISLDTFIDDLFEVEEDDGK